MTIENGQKIGNSGEGIDLGPYFGGDSETAAYFSGKAEWVTLPEHTTLVQQFHQADYVYLLVEGAIAMGIHVEESGMLIHVGDTTRPWTVVGWSGLRPPGRYSTTVHTTRESRFLRWRSADLWRLLYSDPRKASIFIECLVERSLPLLERARRGIRTFGQKDAMSGLVSSAPARGETGANVGSPFAGTIAEAIEVFQSSPFFREFTDQERNVFSQAARFLRVRGGDCILVQDCDPDGLYVLVRGRVSLCFHVEDSDAVVTRTIGRDGTVFNWCGLNRPLPSPFTVLATRDTVLLYIPKDAIAKEAARNPEFGFVYAQRVLWLLGQFFLSAHTRLISQQAENEILAVSSLIDQKATEIPLRSDLYKIPHLLRHPNTRQDAFNILHRLVTSGSPLERSLAGLQLDILTDLERETRFRGKLAYIYEQVAGAEPAATRASLLQVSAKGMLHAFEEVPYVIDGIENLPETAGFVAIYNHLACNAQYQLPNNFEFTLDSHFISALLMRHYGTPGLRIVKDSDQEEFWHRGYYGRILNIKVSPDDSRAARARFYKTVQNTLAAETPVVIAPEGTNNTNNNWTETSPGPLQPGAFVLATRMSPEPWIVPIALANFDKNIKNAVFAAVIKPPFRMSDHVPDPTDREAVSRFLVEYRSVFKNYVEEAVSLAADAESGAALRPDLLSNLGRLDRLDREFADDLHQLEHRLRNTHAAPRPAAFYGSSSFRMWDSLAGDLDLHNVINLGFGGSTLEACAHFFERLVVPHQPSVLFVYAGDNDIGNGASPDDVIERCRALLYKADQFLQGVPVHILSIKPSPYRAHQLDDIARANRGMAALAASRPDTTFIDIFPSMLRADGTPDPLLFSEDMLHMNAAGYARWSAVMRPTVQALETAA